MAQYRQYNSNNTSSNNNLSHVYTNGGGGGGGVNGGGVNGGVGTSSGGGGNEHVAIGIRASRHHHHHHHHKKNRRFRNNNRRISIGTVVTLLCFVLATTGFAFLYLSTSDPSDNDAVNVPDDAFKDDFLANVTRISTSQVKFGHGSVIPGRDSRYWDGDDRRRDEDYNEDEVHKHVKDGEVQSGKGHDPFKKVPPKKPDTNTKRGSDQSGLYNEAGRDELKIYEEKYEASLKNVDHSGVQTHADNHASDDSNVEMENEEVDIDDEYDDGIDLHDSRLEDYDDNAHEVQIELPKSHSGHHDAARILADQNSSQDSSAKVHSENNSGKSKDASSADGQANTISGKRPKRRRKHHSSSSCEMKLLNSTAQLVEPLESRKFARFSLSYTDVEGKTDGSDNWEPRFAGHQSLREREDSFIARDQKINCGFVKGSKDYSGTGFDLVEDDYRYISKCHIAVISCIFGNSDRLRSPFTKAVSRLSRKNVCFVMFVDERTLQTLSSEGQMPDRMGYIGLWKVVVVKNLPFTDMRRVGKIPKLLSHRLFPSARYSIWLDSKLRLQRDPLLLLEHFLWRKGYEYAISNHYDRHCVWEEVERNKKLNKFNHTMIDQQFQFYLADGLKRFNGSDPNKLLPSNVPEGSLIIRAHTPMSNLFSCLWFNEVDRFTPRDQLSFAYTYQKLKKKNPTKPFYLHMFKDCERRQIAKLFHHRTDEKRNIGLAAAG